MNINEYKHMYEKMEISDELDVQIRNRIMNLGENKPIKVKHQHTKMIVALTTIAFVIGILGINNNTVSAAIEKVVQYFAETIWITNSNGDAEAIDMVQKYITLSNKAPKKMTKFDSMKSVSEKIGIKLLESPKAYSAGKCVGLSFTEGLLKLSNYEVDFKEQNASRSMIKAAAFPFVKELKDYDFGFQPSVNEQEMRELASLGFLEKNENIVFLGPSGVGKTHLATSIGIAAAKKRVSTYFIKCNDLLQQLKRAKLENRLDARLKHFCHYRLLIIDELGYLPIDKEDSNLFFQLIDMRYEKKSTILTTNMNFNEWDGIFYDAVVANAIMDRVLHHAHVIPISGKSYRLKDHIKQTD